MLCPPEQGGHDGTRGQKVPQLGPQDGQEQLQEREVQPQAVDKSSHYDKGERSNLRVKGQKPGSKVSKKTVYGPT